MSGADIDPTSFGNTASDYAAYRAGFPPLLFDRLADFGIGISGQRIIDLGTGTGTVARQLAGRGCDVVGVDPDVRLMAEGAAMTAADGVAVEWHEGTAESTGLADDGADVVTAGQCWHWFDRPAAVAEARRVLRPRQGRLAILYLDWIPLAGNPIAATERLIERHNPLWMMGGGHGMWPQWVPEVQAGGFEQIETFSFDLDISYTPEAWRGRIRASAGITVLDDAAKAAFDTELAALLAAEFPGETIAMAHRVWAMVARNPG